MDKRTQYLFLLEHHKEKREIWERKNLDYFKGNMTEVEEEIYLSNLNYLNKKIAYYSKKLKGETE